VGFGPEAIDKLRTALPVDDGSKIGGDFRPAAVLVPLYVADGSVHVVLTQRTDNVRTHQGQVSFPGGGWETEDATMLDTALREAEEEVGLKRADVEVLGVLEDVLTAVSGFVIRPFVGLIPHPYEFVHQAMEVAYVFAPKLEVFADDSRRRKETRMRDGQAFDIYYYDVDGAMVWGATARMLVRLIEVLSAN
jgi:8-oxo-dGTP pyrophosphatase MutT (NUDIX family)